MDSFSESFLDVLQSYYQGLIELGPRLIVGVIALVLLWVLSKYMVNLLQHSLEPRLEDKLILRFILQLMRMVILGFAILAFLNIVGLGGIAAGLWGTAGIGAFIIGFAFKDIGEHFLAGFILAFNRPFRIGDVVEMSGYNGTIVGLSLRHTQLKTFDGKDVYIPNGNVVKNPLVNYTIDGYIRKDFIVGIKYGADQAHAVDEIQKIALAQRGVLKGDKMPSVVINNITKGRLELSVRYWLNTEDKSVSGVEVERCLVQDVIDRLRALDMHDPHPYSFPTQS